MYIDSINDYALSSFGNLLICSNLAVSTKNVTFPNGFNDANPDPYLIFQVLFTNGHNCVDSNTHMTLNNYDVMVNKNGDLIHLPIHKFVENSNDVYKSLQPNTILTLFFNGNQFVVVGNPIVISNDEYKIYADGTTNDTNPISTVISLQSEEIPNGYFACDGTDTTNTERELSTYYPILYRKLGNSNVLPDLRECVLVGAGQSDNNYNASTNPNGIHTHDVYSVGEFKDDQMQSHTHSIETYYQVGHFMAMNVECWEGRKNSTTGSNSGRSGTTTHGKQYGTMFAIKATNEWIS